MLSILVRRSPLPTGELRAHFYDLGPERGFVLVGLERIGD
jgi:hypothetical protein